MIDILTAFGRAFQASPALAMSAAFAWGILSVLLSPCHLASIPLVIAYVGGDRELPSFRRALGLSSLFAGGILVSIAVVGTVTALAGRMLGDVGAIGNYLLAGVFVLVGLNLLGLLRLPSGLSGVSSTRRGPLGALLLGLVFGVALGPCSFAFMAPLLGIGFRLGASQALYGALLLALFGLGHAATIAVAGASGQTVQRYLTWSAGSRGPDLLRKASGLLVIAAGAYFLYAGS